MFGGARRMHKLSVDLCRKGNISRLYSTYDDATTSLTEHIYSYILRVGIIFSDSKIYICRSYVKVFIPSMKCPWGGGGGGGCSSPPYIRKSLKN